MIANMALNRGVAAVLILSACSSSNEKAARQKPDGPPVGQWERLPTGPSSVEMSGQSFLGHEYFSWGGNGSPWTPFLFDVTNNVWSVGSDSGKLPYRLYPDAIWTGEEVLVWGGEDYNHVAIAAPGGAYNVSADTWRIISSVGAPSPREYTNPVWSGNEMIIWGGGDTRTDPTNPPPLGDGFAYNPVTNSWRAISSQGAPSPRIESRVAWTGQELLVWGGTQDTQTVRWDNPNRKYLTSGAAYSPSSDTWRPMSVTGAPTQKRPTVTAWTGKEFLVWVSATGKGAAYDPTTDTWRSIEDRGPMQGTESCGVWTAKYFVVCGDQSNPDGELYDPFEDRWYLMESQLVDTGPGAWGGASGYAYKGDVYIFGGTIGDLPVGDLWGYRYIIASDAADAQP
jgi:hypothetical protein